MNQDVRETFHSEEYEEYYASLDEKIKEKYDYVESIIKTQKVVNLKFVKKLEGTEFYEARVSVGFLNSFLKKNTKRYKDEIEKARKIIGKYI